KNLLFLEIVERRKRRDSPSVDEYIARFPEFADIVRQVLLAAATQSLSSCQEATSVGPTPVAVIPSAAQLGDYRLLRELGRGGMGVVFEAQHLTRGNLVAL